MVIVISKIPIDTRIEAKKRFYQTKSGKLINTFFRCQKEEKSDNEVLETEE